MPLPNMPHTPLTPAELNRSVKRKLLLIGSVVVGCVVGSLAGNALIGIAIGMALSALTVYMIVPYR